MRWVFWIMALALVADIATSPARADGGLVDSAHRMAVALERIADELHRMK